MDNPEEVMQILERFNVSRKPEITSQLEEYITFVARTGDSVNTFDKYINFPAIPFSIASRFTLGRS